MPISFFIWMALNVLCLKIAMDQIVNLLPPPYRCYKLNKNSSLYSGLYLSLRVLSAYRISLVFVLCFITSFSSCISFIPFLSRFTAASFLSLFKGLLSLYTDLIEAQARMTLFFNSRNGVRI